jgi:hypothetical protein
MAAAVEMVGMVEMVETLAAGAWAGTVVTSRYSSISQME